MAQYDKIAEDYSNRDRTDHPQRKYVVYPRWLDSCGDVKGKKALDLGCGNGHSSRLLAAKGAIVTGIDESPEQIWLAQEFQKNQAQKATHLETDPTYVCTNAGNLPDDFTNMFELVTAVPLFHYAKSFHELQIFTREAFRVLKPEGLLAATNQNPIRSKENDLIECLSYRGKWLDAPFINGSRIEITAFDHKGGILCAPFVIYYWDLDTYTRAFAAAGFVNFELRGFKITKEGKLLFPENWEELEDMKQLVIMTARKPKKY